MVFICVFMALIASKGTVMEPFDAYTYSSVNKTGGGIIGGFFAYYLSSFIASSMDLTPITSCLSEHLFRLE